MLTLLCKRIGETACTAGMCATMLALLGACGGAGSQSEQDVDNLQSPTELPGGLIALTGSELDSPGAETPDGNGSPDNNPVVTGEPPAAVETPVDRALRTGSALNVENTNDLLRASLESIETGRTLHQDTLVELFNLQADGSPKIDGTSLTGISWDPTHDASTLISTFGENSTVLYTNAATQSDKNAYQKSIAVIGENPSRYMVLGSNPMRNYRRNSASLNTEMHRFLQNSIQWLTNRPDLSTNPFNVVIAQMHNGFYFPDEPAVREWLAEFFPEIVSFNPAGQCDDQSLAVCLDSNTDLLVISQDMNEATQATDIAATVAAAMDNRIPVLYMHLDGNLNELGASLLKQFKTGYESDNYWTRLRLTDFDITAYANTLPAEVESVRTTLGHLLANDYSFDWSTCAGENCNAVPDLESEMQSGANYVRTVLTGLDLAKINVFEQDGYRFQKLLALTGDHLRQSTTYPMDKHTTDDNVFMRAWFADHAVYHFRSINPVQPDMGNFSRSDFTHITPVNKSVTITSKRNFRSSGVYALPGQTVTVTRNDTSDLDVGLFINTQRPGSTHQWSSNGYSRPKYLKSPEFKISSGETLSFTSPYGGPVQIAFSANDLPVALDFENIGLHPYWSGPEHDESFADQLGKNEYDWAELVTPGFEVHSTANKMRESLADEKWGTAAALAAGTMRYLHNFPHVLAGFQGPGIDIVDEIHDFANAKGFTVDLLDLVKHMNADQATCGYGCSGNPYDAYWAFSPVGHGDVHELGHGLEKKRLRFNGWETHTMTNPYSYYTKSWYYKTTTGDPQCQSLPFEEAFTILQESVEQTNPEEWVKVNLWDTMGWSEGAAMFIQMMMSAQDQGALFDGWHLLARLHIIEREFNRAVRLDDAGWMAKRDALGFGQFSRAEADALDQNDWLLIALATASGLDHTDYLSMWALPYSAPAKAQVSAMNLPLVPRRYYISSATGYCKGEGFNGDSLPVDGTQTWPLND